MNIPPQGQASAASEQRRLPTKDLSAATCASLFSGGGLADIGLMAAGYTPSWTVEIDEAAADCYERNIGAHVIRRSVTEVDPRFLEPVDLLWASPPCPGYSTARSKKLGAHGSEDLGLAIIPYLEALRPRVFLLENVPPYVSSPVFSAIVTALSRLGYMVDWRNVNSADYGVPQTRNRLILRAVRDALLPPLPAPVPWVGWYAAIADLIPTLPESAFAPWQVRRLAEHPIYGDFLLMTGNTQMAMPTGTGMLEAGAPANTVTAASTTARAFLLHGTASRSDSFPVRRDDEPACAVLSGTNGPRAFLVSGTDALVREAEAPCMTLTSTLHEHTALPRAFLASNAATQWGDGLRGEQEPAHAITTQSGGRTRAFIIDDQHNHGLDGLTIRDGREPVFTLGASSHHRSALPALTGGHVVSMTTRALARFMGVPDSYLLPERKSDACRILGNGVPPPVSRALAAQLLPLRVVLEESA